MSLWSSTASPPIAAPLMDTNTSSGAITANRSSTPATDEYAIDDALITDSVKKMLSSDAPHFDLDFDGAGTPGAGQLGPHSAPTVQEGLDLVDALDHLVQNLNAQNHSTGSRATVSPGDFPTLDSSPPPRTTGAHSAHTFDVVLMDHNYCHSYDYLVTTGAPHDPTGGTTTAPAGKQSPHKQTFAKVVSDKTTAGAVNTVPPLSTATGAVGAQNSSQLTSFNDNSYASSSTLTATSPSPTRVPDSPVSTASNATPKCSSPRTPPASRRSQRQIDRIEKSVLEKIKAENQEMLKREKESMESPKLRPNAEPLPPVDDNKDVDEDQLVIDFDKKSKDKTISNNSGKRSAKRQKSHTNESTTNKKCRMDSKGDSRRSSDSNNSAKQLPVPSTTPDISTSSSADSKAPVAETSELDDVIAALRAGDEEAANERESLTGDDRSTPGSARQQRTRRKPKRWDDDEVEVDFSGQLGILAEDQMKSRPDDSEEVMDKSLDANATKRPFGEKPANDESFDGKRPKMNDSQTSVNDDNDDDDESGSDFGSEDDPDKLWCLCRQPHDDRFMIGCDSCEEWFHGKCVNVTKQQGRVMEKEGREWLCPTCVKGISDGVPRDELKRVADQKRQKLEAEERVRAQTKRMAREKFLKREKMAQNAKQRSTERRDSDPGPKKSAQRQQSTDKSPKQTPTGGQPTGAAAAALLARKISQMPPKKRELHLRLETEESEKLKKLIKSSKKDLNKKRELMAKKSPKGGADEGGGRRKSDAANAGPELESISKVVQIVRKPEAKKKHKDAIDFSVQDLFKAEPIKKTSTATPPTPTTPGTPGAGPPFSRKGSVDSRRTSTSASAERQCPAGCGRTVVNSANIYCNTECIVTHVNDMVKLLRIHRRERSESGTKLKDIDRRVVVVEKATGRLLSGKDAIPEREVLDYIKANPTYEVFRPASLKDKKREDSPAAKNAFPSPQKSPTKREDRNRTPISRSNSRSGGDFEGMDPIRANVRTTLKDTLINRCKEANETHVNSNEIQKTANRIEEELFKLFNKDTSGKYRNKYRSLIFNLKDTKNQGLFRKVVNAKIGPERLVQMSAEELASSELAKWREREKISMLEMIKRDAADKVNQVIVKKTHKGEELIESNIVSDTTNDPKLDDLKALTPTATPASGVSSLLDDLMGTSSVDTTAQHRTHTFSNNCRICTHKQTDDSLKSDAKSSNSTSNARGGDETTVTSRPTPKRVRVDSESATRVLLEAAKLTSSTAPPLKRATSADDDDSHEQPTSTVSLSSPEAPSSSSASRPVWKGSIFMQDVAKFAANAVKVSGTAVDYLSQDVTDTISVCGRIAPEQVLDYVKKLKYSSRSEIGLVKFMSRKEDRIGYDAFFDYLNSRGRYGVVGGSGNLKDFYILPLPRNKDVPEVLLPFEGPGLDKKSIRPNLLLGIIIRSKKHGTQAPQNSAGNQSLTKASRSGSDAAFRSYTPPPKTSSNDSSPGDSKDADEDVSYTPPRATTSSSGASMSTTSKTVVVDDDDEPYDPEEADLTSTTTTTTTTNSLDGQQPSIPELMEQIAKSSNPVEMTTSVLNAIAGSSNIELQRRLLEQLTAKVDEQKRQLEVQKAEAEAQSSSAGTSGSSSSGLLIPGLDGQFASSLKDITIPDNLPDILSTVKHKTLEIERQQERLRAVAASGFKFDDPIVKNFGSKAGLKDSMDDSSEAMDLDEDVSQMKTTILEVNTPLSGSGGSGTSSGSNSNSGDTGAAAATTAVGPKPPAIDPRLRSKKQTPLPSISQETGSDSHVAAMTSAELMEKAREQMAALAQMEGREGTPNDTTGAANTSNSSNNRNNSQKIKIEWKKKK